MADSFEGTKEYANILRDTDCLRILYYLYKFNPNIPVGELSERLGIDKARTVCGIEKLTKARLVLKEDGGGYSLTPFGRSAFRNLLGEA